jgi:uncharacterized protein (DUF2141 family)
MPSFSASLLLVLALLAPPAAAQEHPGCETASPTRLRLAVHGVRSADGNVTVALYGDNPEDFLARGKRLQRERVPAREGTVSLCFALPHPGTYAVALYHDEDGDKRLTRSFIGLPTEGYGFSRDAPTAFGLPNFEDVAFSAAPGETRLEIKMRY